MGSYLSSKTFSPETPFFVSKNEVCVSNKNNIITATGDLNFIIKKQSPMKLGTDLI